MPSNRNKRTIVLEHSGVEYINSNGQKAKADFRHTDAKESFIGSQSGNRLSSVVADDKPVRVYRKSRLGERLLARFFGSTKADDAQAFADEANEVYEVRGFYSAIVK